MTTVKIDEAERFGCIGDQLHEDWKVGARNAKNVIDDAGGDLRGDVIDKIDRSEADARLDKLGRQRRRLGPYSVHQLERKGTGYRRAATQMDIAVGKQHARFNEVEDGTRDYALY